MTDPTHALQKKTHRICSNLRNDRWQKWGGHVHPSPPRGDAPGYRKSRDLILIFLQSALSLRSEYSKLVFLVFTLNKVYLI